MYLNDFSARIPEGNEASGGYVEMRHGQTYTLRLRNSRDARCDARVEVDGKHVGTWRIHAHSGITLERPAHDIGKFTFYKLGTTEADAAQLNGGDPNLGLVKVTFTPEKVRHYHSTQPVHPWSAPNTYLSSTKGVRGSSPLMAACSYQAHSAGGTGLSGISGQQFTDAAHIDYDYSQQTTIHLRLVCKENHDHEPRPLTSTSNPIPPRIW